MQLQHNKTKPQSLIKLDKGTVELVKQNADPELILNMLGISLSRIYGNFGRARCPFHAGQTDNTFSINLITGHWQCFSSGCHEGYSDIIGLVQLSLGCSFIEAIKYLATLLGINTESPDQNLVHKALIKKDMKDFIRRTEKSNLEMNLCTISNIEERIFEWVQNRVSYFYDQGYTQAIQDYFEIGFCYDRYNIPRASFPIRDLTGRIVAWDGRRLDGKDDLKYFIDPPGFPKGKILYHYHKAVNYIPVYNGLLYIVEGYKACWSMVQAGYMNTVACMGAGLLGEQAGILLENLGLKKVIFVLDGDAAGKNGSRRSQRQLNHLIDVVVIDMPDGEDPSTLESNILHSLLKL